MHMAGYGFAVPVARGVSKLHRLLFARKACRSAAVDFIWSNA
jgi:hypothetical protein